MGGSGSFVPMAGYLGLLPRHQCRVIPLAFDSTIVVCAHNEEMYIVPCLRSIRAQTVPPSLIIVVLDRCKDNTKNLAISEVSSRDALILKKDVTRWKNSIPENLELGRINAKGNALVIVDADMVVPPNFLERLLPQTNKHASVSAVARTDPDRGHLNRLVSIWERTFRFAPFGEQPRGGCRAVSLRALSEIGGFRDVIAWDSDLDKRLRKSGYRVRLDRTIVVLHTRKMTMRRSIKYQIETGKARRQLGIGFGRTLLHSLIRLRPFVIYGYFKGGRTEVLAPRSETAG